MLLSTLFFKKKKIIDNDIIVNVLYEYKSKYGGRIWNRRIILYQELKGEYAYLKRTDIESEEELFIAMALLPLGVDIGTKLHYECMEYSII